ncbi:hypothetical protein RSOLAG22IIIB_11346 [Rhizoctonia solani]|uniref:MFS general substrate transporter n=1 Tax=Rhizoctonia solani TaxID=456999 RepID=A0A0K6G7Z6_9AGAM|nr:hypothetical protein RSOLAG22IIIB_11346 [Rhizoctonia solani]
MAVTVVAIFILPDFPSTTSWLSPMERCLAEVRMAEDAGGEVDRDTKEEARARTILLLLCAPPWAFATIVAFINARHADKTDERFWHIAGPLIGGIVGFVIAEATMHIASRYIALFLMAQSYAGFIVFFSWCSNSLPRPPSKRAVTLALINAFSQLGNIAGSYIWPTQWGATYRKSYAICIACFVCAIVMCFAFRQHLISLNQRLDNGEEVEGMQERRDAMEEAAELEGVTVEEIRQRRKGFRFAY